MPDENTYQPLTIELLNQHSVAPDSFENYVFDNYSSVFTVLNDWILDGSYCSTDDFTEILNRFRESCNTSLHNYKTFFSQDNGDNFYLQFETSQFLRIIDYVDSFSQFIEQVHSKLRFEDKEYFLNLSIKDDVSYFNLSDSRIEDASNDPHSNELVFRCNLFIAHCDHFLTSDNQHYLSRLDEIIEYLKDAQSSHLKKITYKARYIRYKVILRKALQEKKLSNRKTFVISEGKKTPLDPKKNFKDLQTYFGEWLTYLTYHYELSPSYKEKVEYEFNLLEGKQGEIDEIKELHLRIKYFKDVSPQAQPLKKLRSIVEKDNLKAKDFDKYAHTVYFTYLINNYFSLLCLNMEKNKEIIIAEYKNSILLLEKLETRNYFIHSKYIEFLLWDLKSEYENLSTQSDLSKKLLSFKTKIDECEEVIENYKKNIHWVKDNYNYVFQLPFEECLVEFDEGKLFVFSSFVLPIDRTEMEGKFQENEILFKTFKSSSFAYNSLGNLYKSYKELKEENEHKDSKNIEVLAIFVAIVTFTAGVIPGFKFIENGIEAIFFTLALGLSMSAFGITLFSISRNISNWKKVFKHFSIFIIFSAILWGFSYWYLNEDFKRFRIEQKQKEIKKELLENDFELKVNMKKDSLK